MINPNKSIIGANIRRFRGLRGLTQKQLAQKTGVEYQHIGRWERGVNPTAKYLAKLASALDVDISELTTPPAGAEFNLQPTAEIDTEEVRQKRFIEEVVATTLARDPRLRLIDERLDKLINYLRSSNTTTGKDVNEIAQLKSQLEQAINSREKLKKELDEERKKRIPDLEQYRLNKTILENFKKKNPSFEIEPKIEEEFLLFCVELRIDDPEKSILDYLKWFIAYRNFTEKMEFLFCEEPEVAQPLQDFLERSTGKEALISFLCGDKS